MARLRNPNRDKAFNLYKEHNGNIKPKELGNILCEDASIISRWKSTDKWDEKLNFKRNKRGAPKGNSNAVGNKGGAPECNLNAFKHGGRIPSERFKSKKFLAKYLPKVTESIMDDVHNSGITTLDILWMSIELQVVAIIRTQKIMHVTSKNEIKKQLRKQEFTPGKWGDHTMEEYEVQFAWDRQERFVAVQSKAFKTLSELIKSYEDLLNKNWDLATEEQKLRIQKLKGEVEKLTSKEEGPIQIQFIKASDRNE